MNKSQLIHASAALLLATLPLGLTAATNWPSPPPPYPSAGPVQVEQRSYTHVAYTTQAVSDDAVTSPAPAPAVAQNPGSIIYNGPIVNMAPASTPTPEPSPYNDYNPTLVSRRHKPDPASDPHQRGLKLGGPRVGFTYVNGAGFDKLKKSVQDQDPNTQVDPYLVQFGWQFEYRMFRTDEGISELIPLVGGLNQGIALPSCSWLMGLRNVDGLEVGVGPDFGVDGASFLVAVGDTVDLGGINVPLNAAVGMGANRTTTMNVSVGFNL